MFDKLTADGMLKISDQLQFQTMPNAPFLSLWVTCRPGNAQNGGTVLPIANLMADSESGSPDSYSSFLVTIGFSRL